MNLWDNCDRPIFIGMVHLGPLPGAPRFDGDWTGVLERAERDADALLEGGVDGFIIENFGDTPFYPDTTPPETVAAMTAAACRLRRISSSVRIGVNVLRNDAEAAMCVAKASECDFIRVNVLTGTRLTDQGIVTGQAHRLLRLRRRIQAESVAVFADVDVKHSAPIAERSIETETNESLERGGADAVIVSGAGTGEKTRLDDLHSARSAALGRPVFIGSGVTLDSASEYAPLCDGFIVGSWLKKDGQLHQPVDAKRVQDFANRIR